MAGVVVAAVGAWVACGAGACSAVLFTEDAAGAGACVVLVGVDDFFDWLGLVVFIASTGWGLSFLMVAMVGGFPFGVWVVGWMRFGEATATHRAFPPLTLYKPDPPDFAG